MARTVNQEEHARKRTEILGVAQRLVQTQGFMQMSIQELLDELDISKGAFYHYFDSKAALLEGLAERMCDGVVEILAAVVDASDFSALEKFNRFFAEIGRWKGRDVNLYLALAQVWYADENAILRQKIRVAMVRRIAPLLTQVLRQGIEEESMAPAFPAQTGQLLALLIQDMNDAVAAQLVDHEHQPPQPAALMDLFAAYSKAMERILAAPPGSLALADGETLGKWTSAHEAPGSG